MAATLHLLTGPTASGKSALALAWAQAHGAEILSCDALQVYQGLDIGTAKPTAAERALVPHHGLDLCDPARAFSVAEYRDYAARTVAEIHARGGRRCWSSAAADFTSNVFLRRWRMTWTFRPSSNEEVRAWKVSGGLAALVARLRAASPAGTGAVDLRNPRRVSRALARCLASGLGVPELAARFAQQGTPFDSFEKKLVRIDRAPAELAERIRARAAQMVRAGLIEEVRRWLIHCARTPPPAPPLATAKHWHGSTQGEKAPRAELAEAIAQRTRQLVKKQRTWFRTQLPPHRVDAVDVDG